ncbi:MAG: hypothetical protein K2M12_08200, partial [Muribaculaceae bacterium]|nr:hypothetical protein [Muribaculaceae bacterium]
MVKRLLLISMSLIAMSAAAQTGETTVLWTGEAALSWDGATAPHIDADKCTDIIAGDKIVLTVSEFEAGQDWPSCYLRSASNHTELCGTGLWDYKNETLPVSVDIEVPYDAAIVAAFKEGFYAVGTGATITGISVKQTGDPSVVLPTGNNVLWFDPKGVELSWSNSVTIAQDKTADLEAGQV